jgi:hypothetical protein
VSNTDANNPLPHDDAFWVEIAIRSPELEENPEGAAHLAFRFAGKYLPIVLGTKDHEARERVWLAFWSYLTARETSRKPFGLSSDAADEIIGHFRAALDE